jgi:Zn-dependent peptidase ImmA (M78 family)
MARPDQDGSLLQVLAKYFKVSTLVILRRLYNEELERLLGFEIRGGEIRR